MKSFRPHAALLLSAVVIAASTSGRAQDLKLPLNLSARTVNMTVLAPGDRAKPVDIRISRWSTDAERDSLIRSFMQTGPDPLLDALQDFKPAGFIRLPSRIALDVRFARLTQLDDGYRILLMTDRGVGEGEAVTQPHTRDYRLTIIEIHMKNNGTGEGALSVATKIRRNEKDNGVEIENWASEPVHLTNITIAK